MRSLGVLVLFSLLAVSSPNSETVSTDHVDVSRQNWNSAETILTPAVVAGGKFHRLKGYTVDGGVYAQPLYIPAALVGGVRRDLLIVATMNNSVYAFDADSPGSSSIWQTNFGSPNVTYPNHSQVGNTLLWGRPLGCLSTPAVDVAAAEVFAVCATVSGGWVLRSLDLGSGAVLASQTVTGQYPGSGDPGGGDTVIGGQLQFNSPQELQRVGLTLANGNIYFAFSSYGDDRPWHGWVFSYRETDLAQQAVWCSSPNDFGAGIWGAGGGFSVDGSGNLYALTGNGNFNAAAGTFGEAVIKLAPNLTLADYFVPSNWATLSANDSDLSSGRAILVPGTTLLVAGGKDFRVYSIDTACMGHLQGSPPTCTGVAPQLFVTNSGGVIGNHSGIYGGLFFNGAGYFPTVGGSIYKFSITGTAWNITPAVVSAASYAFPGATMTASSNGAANGVIWATTAAADAVFSPQGGTLRALNPADLSEYWNSDTSPSDNLGTLSKFAAPTVAAGRVFVANQDGQVQVFGLLSSSDISGSATLRGSAVLR